MKIKQTKKRLGLKGERPWEETIVAIRYDNREGGGYHSAPAQRFYIKLPGVVADALGVDEVKGDNQVDVMERFDEAIERFKKLETEVNRVILYQLEVGPLPEGHPNRERYHYSSNQSLQVKIWAGTYEETVCIAGDGVRRYSYEHIKGDLIYPGQEYHDPNRGDGSRCDRQLPWTEKNAAFFQWVLTQMLELVNTLSDLYEPDKMIEAINAGRLLPLGATEHRRDELRRINESRDTISGKMARGDARW